MPDANGFGLHVTDEGIAYEHPARNQFVSWARLWRVAMMNWEERARLFHDWWLEDLDGAAFQVPYDGLEGTAALAARLQGLPGFERKALARALASSDEGKWICWTRL